MVSRVGFGLVEVTVALTLLSVGLLGVAACTFTAARLLRESQMAELAAFEAGQVLDSLARVPNAHAGERKTGVLGLSWTVSNSIGSHTVIAVTTTYRNGSRTRTEQFFLEVKK